MTRIHTIKLEIIRPGPPHNQLLSPLTPYMALCGEGSPITFYLDFEHSQFLHRLERLRYVTFDRNTGIAVSNPMREATVTEVGMDVARIFAKVNSLLAEECRVMGDAGTMVEGDDAQLVHLRIIVSGSELSLIPFEMAVSPQAYPGEGVEWALQNHLPIVPIREIRRTRPAPVRWDRVLEPKVLFISAAPQGLEVPLALQVQALRTALDPWIRWPKPQEHSSGSESAPAELEQKRLPFIKERLRVLPNASIEEIYSLCAQEKFTHVHILAHGAQTEVAGEKRYGLALSDQTDRNRMNVVSGKRLAKALLAEGEDGIRRSQPLMVTLATCDSGNPGSVFIPGGSIAHDLHAAGIPWVVASQFPLTKVGSVRMAEAFYQRILRGDDPRQVLYEVRRQLYMSAERDHDWASLVAYATIPPDFDDQVTAFFERQMRQAITVALNHADNAVDEAEMESALQVSIDKLDLWQARLPKGDDLKARVRRAECYGMYGSTWKRIALLHYKKNQREKGQDDLEKALVWYTKAMTQWAMDESKDHWVTTQALSLCAVLDKRKEPEAWLMAYKCAERDLAKSDESTRAWAHGTLAELVMLAKYHIPSKAGRNVEKTVREHCQAILDLMGEAAFEVYSTRQQFQRYLDYWRKPYWGAVAQAAIAALSPSGSKGQSELPPYA